MKLSNFTEGRDNNFSLIRIVAALAVLVSHSFALAIGASSAQPFQKILGMTIGEIAVDVFFITSGFLVTSSLLTRQSFIEFVWARVLRIFPALLIMLLLVVFGLGIFFTTLPVTSYLTNSAIYEYLLKCATLINGVAFHLPGVFESNPYKKAVNGSLWTMPYEVRMYAILAVGWVVLGVIKKSRLEIFKAAVVASYAVYTILIIACHFYFPTEFSRFFLMFFSGAAFFVLRDYIKLYHSIFWLFVVTLVSASLIYIHLFFAVYVMTVSYVLFYLAYIPSGYVRKYNKLGDYSYGVYIYAFPVQQSVVALIPGVSVWAMIVISACVTLLLAVLSWHLLERRMLSLKGHYVGHTYRLFSYR